MFLKYFIFRSSISLYINFFPESRASVLLNLGYEYSQNARDNCRELFYLKDYERWLQKRHKTVPKRLEKMCNFSLRNYK